MKLNSRTAPSFALVLMLFAAPCIASEAIDTNALLAPVNAWVDGFNRWDAHYPENAFTDDAVVIDQFPPFLWSGKGSPREWWATLMGKTPARHEYGRSLKQHVEFAPPQFVQVTERTAYFVQPGTLTWHDKKGRHEMKARWVVTETKTPQGWRISSHAWAPVSEAVR